MLKRKSNVRPRRKVIRRRRVARPVRRSLNQTKIYRYAMAQRPTYYQIGPGTFATTGNLSGSVNSTCTSTVTPAKSGFADYYDFGMGIQFRLSDLANANDFTTMYDQYRLDSITLSVSFLQSQASSASSALLPTVYMIEDRDDATPPITVSEVAGRQGYKMCTFGNRREFHFTIKPHTSGYAYDDGVAGNTGHNITKRGTWNDSAFPTINHYAMKLFFTDVYGQSTGSNTGFKFIVKGNYSFKGAFNEF